jgi:hypothetical protein
VPLVIKGAASQSAVLQSWQNSAATELSRITSSGSFYVNTNNNTTGVEFLGTSGTQLISANGNDLGLRPRFDILFSPADSSGRLRPSNDNTSDLGTSGQRWKNIYSSGLFVTNSTVGNVVSTIRAASGQTGNLTEWQDNSGNTLTRINNTGIIITNTKLIVGATTGILGTSSLYANDASTIALAVRGAASQTANLQEWQNSAGTVLTSVTSTGVVNINNASLRVNTAGTSYGARIQTNTDGAGVIGQVIRGTASQTANLQEWQDSTSTIKARVDSGGNFKSNNVASLNSAIQMTENASGGLLLLARATAAASNPGANFASLYFRDGTTAGTLKLVVRAGAAGAETTILDNIPQ